MRILKIILLLILCINSFYCKKDIAQVSLFDENNPMFVIGSDKENVDELGIYDVISLYYVDTKNNVYIGDIVETRIDKFSSDGNYLFSIGRKGQGPGEFEGIPAFAVNSEGFLYTTSIRKKFMIFGPKGVFLEEIDFPDEFEKDYKENIKIDYNDNIYVLFSSSQKGYRLVKFDKKMTNYSIIHTDDKRNRLDYTAASVLPLLIPDFNFDKENNVYITDTVDYSIYVYSSNGELKRIFKKDFNRNKITEHDLIFNVGEKIVDLSFQANYIFKDLKGGNRFLPSVFGININNDKVLVWTSNQDKDFKYIIDIYDLNFNYIGSGSYYNFLPRNMLTTMNNIFYVPNIAPDNLEIKEKIGRLSLFNIPYKLLAYE
ncbi:MAG: 6-bladed beta-propeller, partial [Candidatus Aminicenantes bacterium]|nr:6-bladed beta-propeller [Candidatus Aminicenantes bacterium]